MQNDRREKQYFLNLTLIWILSFDHKKASDYLFLIRLFDKFDKLSNGCL